MTPVDSLVITTGKVVLFHYTLRDPAGDVIDTSSEGPPMPYLHGAGNIVPGLENAMSGRAVGEQFEVIVAPEDGYGPRELPGPQSIPRNAFPASAPIAAGMQFMAQPPGGPPMPLWIVAVQDDEVVVDFNHPLAGVPLHFTVEVIDIRDATDEEQMHGHPHGPDGTGGHDHGHDHG